MSDDKQVAQELVETLRDGENGLRQTADKVRDEHAPWAETLERYAQQRADFRAEIVDMGEDYGDDVDESGSAAAAVHRGWVGLKDALTGDDASAVLKAASDGEDHAVSEYEKALDQDLSDGFRQVVSRQHNEVKKARDEIKTLGNAS
ncbi:PA2169 family four-helix-bundle protein [Nocardioidaceae bacterium]|nr:PA2169 family four-helix-bundle protein [Nocardioidaceae bacterium]